MMKRLMAALAVAICSVGIVLAAPVNGVITKIDGNKITVNTKDKATKKEETKTYEATANLKVVKMDKKDKIEVPGGLKAEPLKSIGAKGLPATLEVDGDKVSEITIKVKKDK